MLEDEIPPTEMMGQPMPSGNGVAQLPVLEGTPDLPSPVGADPLSPDALRALAEPPAPVSSGNGAAPVAEISSPSVPVAPDVVPTAPPAQGGLHVSPAFLVLGALLLLALGAVIGLTLAGG